MDHARPVASDRMIDLISGMPKTELHIHIEGSLEPELMLALAAKNGRSLGFSDAASLRAAYDFNGLQSFLELYHAGTQALATRDDFTAMCEAYLDRAAADHVSRAEIFFDTQTHLAQGLSSDDVILGLHDSVSSSKAKRGVDAALILCFLRHLSEEEAFEALEAASAHLDKIAAVGLASSENGHPPSKFARVFAKARSMGLRAVAHAGEEGPPSYIHEALDLLHVDRIDHGVRAMEDPALVARLAREGIPLTVCPLSNLRLKVFERMDQHPLRLMLEAGMAPNVNSDDPSYFGGYVNENFIAAIQGLGMGANHAKTLALNGFRASFMDAQAKRAQMDRVEDYFENFR